MTLFCLFQVLLVITEGKQVAEVRMYIAPMIGKFLVKFTIAPFKW